MKVLLYDMTCAYLTPGGKATHAHKLFQEISKLGVDVQYARWWDEAQKDFDLIHFLAPVTDIARRAKSLGKKTFFSMLFDHETSKSGYEKMKALVRHRIAMNLPFGLSARFGYWNALPYMDRIQFMHEYDRRTALKFLSGYIDAKKTLIIPHAYDPADMYLGKACEIRTMKYPSKYLVSCANISRRKQTVLLARYAKKAQVPVVFMGSRNENDPYYKEFLAEIDNRYVFYPGYVSREWRDCIEANASGYVLLSTGESGCIAVYEAAAYKMPLLLSNMPWAWGYDSPTDISYCDWCHEELAVKQLQQFYEKAGRLDHLPFNALTWAEVAKMYVRQYEEILED